MSSDQRSAPLRVLVTCAATDELRRRLAALGAGFRIDFRPTTDRAEIDALVPALGVEVLVGPFPPRDLRRASQLRWLQLDSAGVDRLLSEAPWDHGLVVTNARGAFAVAIGQYVLAAILRINEHADERRALQGRRAWATGEVHDELTGRLVRGQAVLVVGYGGVGREIARVVDALAMRVVAVKNRPAMLHDDGYRVAGTGDPDGSIPEQIVGIGELPNVLPLADVVVLTLPLTNRTRGMFDAGMIEAMRSDAWLINVGRGAVVDEPALVDALVGRRIGGAVLDVFTTEPLPSDSPLWDAPNTVVTPHVSGGDASSDAILADLVAENLRRYAAGEPLLNVVDPRRQY